MIIILYQISLYIYYTSGESKVTIALPSVKDAMQVILGLIYGDSPAELQTWEKLLRNTEIYWRYVAGEDSVVLGRAFGLGDHRIRDIIKHERKRRSQ